MLVERTGVSLVVVVVVAAAAAAAAAAAVREAELVGCTVRLSWKPDGCALGIALLYGGLGAERDL